MIARFLAHLKPPAFDGDEEKTRSAGILNVILLSSLLTLTLYLLFGRAVPNTQYVASAGVVTLVLWLVMKRGYIRFASIALIVGMAILVGTDVFTSGGVKAPAYPGFLVLILLAGLMLGWKAAIIMTLSSIVYGLILIQADATGWLPESTEFPQLAYWLTNSILSAMTGVVLILTLRLIQSALDRAAKEIRERERAEQEVNLRLKELTAVHHAAQQLESLLLPEQLAQKIIEVLEEMLNFEFAAVLLVDEANRELIPFALSDQGKGPEFLESDKEYVRSKNVQLGTGITGWVAQHGQSLLLGDVRKDARYRAMRDDIRSELCVPILKDGTVIGVINIETTRPEAYSTNDQRVLETVAATISVAIQNSNLLKDLQGISRRLGQVEEAQRRAISRELHDRVGQNLTALSINLQNMKGLVGADSADALAPKFDDTQELVQDTTRFIREVMADLHPPELDDYGLGPALETYAERAASRAKLELIAELTDLQPPLPLDKSIALFRAAQEAITNTLKHAQATQLEISLEERDGIVRLKVADDGRGFAPGRQSGNGTRSWGMKIMKRRIESIGGNVRVESQPGEGTRVTFEMARLA